MRASTPFLLLVQSAAFAAAGASEPDKVTLPEFNVREELIDSYVASESMTGSRVAEKIKNLSYPVNIITSEFLRDFAFFELNEDLAFTTSFANNVSENGTQRIRGLGTAKSLRNGFQRIGMLADPANIDRVEVIKGASAAIYGEIQPAGMVNIVSKRPSFLPGYRGSVSIGSNDLFRGQVEATGPMGKSGKTAYLLTGAYYETGYEQEYATLRQRVASLSLLHRFSPQTSLLVELEHIYKHTPGLSQIPQTNDASIVDPTKRMTRLATFEEVGFFNFTGPWHHGEREVNAAMLTFEHRFSPIWSVRAGASYSNRGNWNQTTGTPVLQLSGANRGTVSRALNRGGITEDIGQVQVDFLAQYPALNGALENRTLFTVDYFSNYHTDPSWGLPTPNNATTPGSLTWLINRGLFQQNMRPFEPAPNYSAPEFSIQNFPTISRNRQNRTDIGGLFLRQQTAAWRGRLYVVGGLRYDRVRFSLADKAVASQRGDPALIVTEKGTTDAWSPSAGVNYALIRHVRVYANYARSFFANTQNRTAGSGNNTSNERGFGWDYGFKVDLLEERLNFTLGGYYVVRNNVTVSDVDPLTGLVVGRPVGNTLSRGFEFDANWKISNSFTALFGYGFIDSQVTYAGVDREVVGRPTTGTPEDNGYVALRYAFKERSLTGLSVTLGVTYTGESYPFSEAGGITTGGLILSHNGQRDIAIPAYYATRAGVSYSWNQRKYRLGHSIALNAVNVFDQRDVTLSRRFMEPRTFSATYSLRY